MRISASIRLVLAALLVGSCIGDKVNNKTEADIEKSLALSRAIDAELVCAWSNRYSLCFCGYNFPYNNAVLVVVPNNRCGHD